jgi:hypothetical protein
MESSLCESKEEVSVIGLLQHLLNEVHLYCRMVDAGVPCWCAIKIARIIGRIINPALYRERR